MTQTAVEIYNEIIASPTADNGPFGMREVDANGRKVRVYVNTTAQSFATLMTALPDRILVHEENRQTTYVETKLRSAYLNA